MSICQNTALKKCFSHIDTSSVEELLYEFNVNFSLSPYIYAVNNGAVYSKFAGISVRSM